MVLKKISNKQDILLTNHETYLNYLSIILVLE